MAMISLRMFGYKNIERMDGQETQGEVSLVCVSGNKEREATSSLTLTRRKDTLIVVLLDSSSKKSRIKGYTSKLNPRDVL